MVTVEYVHRTARAVKGKEHEGVVTVQTEQGTLLLKAKAASKLTGIPEQTLYEGAAAGRIPCLRLGRSVWFSRSELFAWIERETRGGNDSVD